MKEETIDDILAEIDKDAQSFHEKYPPVTVMNTTDGPVLFNIKEISIKLPEAKDFRKAIRDDYFRVMRKLDNCSLQSMLDFEFVMASKFGKFPDINVEEFLVTYRKGKKSKM